MSIIVFSSRNIAAPSFIIRKATSSVTLPSRIKCCMSTDGFGFPFESKTSLIVRRWLGGNGTPLNIDHSHHSQHYDIQKHELHCPDIFSMGPEVSVQKFHHNIIHVISTNHLNGQVFFAYKTNRNIIPKQPDDWPVKDSIQKC